MTVQDEYRKLYNDAFRKYYYIDNLTADRASRKANIYCVQNVWESYNYYKKKENNG